MEGTGRQIEHQKAGAKAIAMGGRGGSLAENRRSARQRFENSLLFGVQKGAIRLFSRCLDERRAGGHERTSSGRTTAPRQQPAAYAGPDHRVRGARRIPRTEVPTTVVDFHCREATACPRKARLTEGPPFLGRECEPARQRRSICKLNSVRFPIASASVGH